jgi:hypothetical protein
MGSLQVSAKEIDPSLVRKDPGQAVGMRLRPGKGD